MNQLICWEGAIESKVGTDTTPRRETVFVTDLDLRDCWHRWLDTENHLAFQAIVESVTWRKSEATARVVCLINQAPDDDVLCVAIQD